MPTLNWIGKDKVINHHHDVPFRVLEHRYGFRADSPNDKSETDSGNKIIHGDNLEALKALLPQYEGKIDCIYIDPPYNTGNEGWVYNDNVNDPHIRKWLGEVVGQEDEDFSRHDKWLCMMYPRLVLMRQLLSDKGVIFISINYISECAHLRLICDDIFGKDNFIGELTWESTTQPINSGSAKFKLQQKVEPILFYAKNKKLKDSFILQEIESNITYPHIGKLGACRFEIIEKSNAGEYERPTMQFEILGQKPREGKRWQIGEETAKTLIQNNRLEIIDGIVKKAIYPEDELEKRKFKPFWSHFSANIADTAMYGKEQLNTIMGYAVGFDTVKPTRLLEQLISYLPSNIIVLDSFAGSATTAHAILNLNKRDGGNRRFILVEMMDYAETITAERVRRVMSGYAFSGKREEEIYSKKLTTKNILQAEAMLEEARQVSEAAKDNYDKIGKPKIDDNSLKVIATKIYTDRTEGLGGEFDYYELGARMFNDDETLNEEIDDNLIREYIYYTETRRHLTRRRSEDYPYLLDYHNDIGYFFYYEKDRSTILSPDTLCIVPHRADHYVIYANVCTIDKEQLTRMNITFKKIPRDINRF